MRHLMLALAVSALPLAVQAGTLTLHVTAEALATEGFTAPDLTRDGWQIRFDRVAHACGEFVGDMRKGFVTDTAPGHVEITLHLDHIFGRADLTADAALNRTALGFDQFASGGTHDISRQGIHLGHMGKGHCHDTTL